MEEPKYKCGICNRPVKIRNWEWLLPHRHKDAQKEQCIGFFEEAIEVIESTPTTEESWVSL